MGDDDDDDEIFRREDEIREDSSFDSKSSILFKLLTAPADERRTRFSLYSTDGFQTASNDLNAVRGSFSGVFPVGKESLNSGTEVITGYSVLDGIVKEELVNDTNESFEWNRTGKVNGSSEFRIVSDVESKKSAPADAGDSHRVDHSIIVMNPLQMQHLEPNLVAYVTAQAVPVSDNSPTILRNLLTDQTFPQLSNGMPIAANELNEVSKPSVLRELLSSNARSSRRKKKNIPLKKKVRRLKNTFTCGRNDSLKSSFPHLRKILPKSTYSTQYFADNKVVANMMHMESFHLVEEPSTMDCSIPVVPQNLIKVQFMQELNEELSVDEILPDVFRSSPSVNERDETVNGCSLAESIVKKEPQDPPSSSYDNSIESELSPSLHFAPFQERNKIEVFVDSILGTVVKFEQNGHFDNINCESNESPQHFFEENSLPKDSVGLIADEYICFSDNV